MFATVLHNLKSPENVSIIVRAHVAYGGNELIIVGQNLPWRFKKNMQRFSRRLERICNIIYIKTDNEFFAWCHDTGYDPIAVEIPTPTVFLRDFAFPDKPAIIVGNEGHGLPEPFLKKCTAVVTIPQYGPVACLNAAVSCATAMYEFCRAKPVLTCIDGHKYKVDEEITRLTAEDSPY